MDNTKIDLNANSLELDLQDETPPDVPATRGSYKVIIADCDSEIHSLTKMILPSFQFEGKSLTLIDTYSGQETMEALAQNPDTAVLFLDFVMEENHSGLNVVEYLRKTLKNHFTRIILRIGQDGEAPKDKVIREYDITDYRVKSELTDQRLNTSLYAALRSYRDIMQIDRNRRGLEKMIKASSEMFSPVAMSDFLGSILDQIASFCQDDREMLFIRGSFPEEPTGFTAAEHKKDLRIVAAKGKYDRYINEPLDSIPQLASLYRAIQQNGANYPDVTVLDNGFIIKQSGHDQTNNFLYVEGEHSHCNLDVLNLFLTNYALALDNFYLLKQTAETQTELIHALGEVIEVSFEETSGHLKRVTQHMYDFAKILGMSDTQAEFVKIASALHDVGKIAIPQEILRKPGKLTFVEMATMKRHAKIGHEILSNSHMPAFQIAAEIALHHHEKYDGTGYPDGLRGENIPLYSRMMAIVDVFDAMTHKRVDNDAFTAEETLDYMESKKGTHFDPELLGLFIAHLRAVS